MWLCSLSLSQASDGSFTGFIKVQLRLSRPVTVSSVEALGAEEASKPAEVQNQPQSEEQEGTDGVSSEKRTSFYLPSDCVKQLHISSLTTTREVIQGLLKKFMVLDNPQKFALYRRTHRDGQGEEGKPNPQFKCGKNNKNVHLSFLCVQISSRSFLWASILFVWGWLQVLTHSNWVLSWRRMRLERWRWGSTLRLNTICFIYVYRKPVCGFSSCFLPQPKNMQT